MISIFLTDRLGKFRCASEFFGIASYQEPTFNSFFPSCFVGRKIKVFCEQDDTIEDLKKVVALQLHTEPTKLRIQRGSSEYKNHITLA